MKFKSSVSNNRILAVSIGAVYLWFGVLKFFSGSSPAEDLAKNTIDAITFQLIPSDVSIVLLAIWETLVGVLLITNFFNRTIITLALVHLLFTFTPLFIFPDQVFVDAPFQFTLLGQYIFKNVILIAALLTLYKLMKPAPQLE